MAVTAELSRHKRNTIIIYAVVCIALAGYFIYDGYYNQKFIDKYTTEEGVPEGTLVFNQKAPYFLVPLGIAFGIYLLIIRNKKVVLEGNKLLVDNKEIDCDSIEKIDKTFFDAKGYFVVTYRDQSGAERNIRISDRNYDNLEPVLEELVTKIS